MTFKNGKNMKKILFLALTILLTASSQDLIAMKGYTTPKQKAKSSTPTKKMTRAEKNSSQHQQQHQQQAAQLITTLPTILL